MKKNRHSITFKIGGSLATMVFLPVFVATTAIYGFFNFKTYILQLTNQDLPQIVSISNLNSQLAHLLYQTEQLSTAQTNARRRITYDILLAQFETVRQISLKIEDPSFRNLFEKRVNILRKNHVNLNELVENLIGLKAKADKGLAETTQVFEQALRLRSQAMIWGRNDPTSAGYLSRWFIAKSDIVSTSSVILSSRYLYKLNKDRRAVEKNLIILEKSINALPIERRPPFSILLEKLETTLMSSTGLFPLMANIHKLRAKAVGRNNFAIAMVQDLEAQSARKFKELHQSTTQKSNQISNDIDVQTRLFGALVVFAILFAIGVYVYFNKTLTRRLLRLNYSVQSRIAGNDNVITEPGNDEISDIAGSVNYFADELNLAIHVAEESNKAKSLFLANMSHELRSPLNAIMGLSQLIERETFGPVGNPHYKEYSKDILSSGEHLLGVINSLLDLSKIEAGRFELQESQVDVYEAALFAQSINTNLADQLGVTITVTKSSPAVHMSADGQIIRQILLNLVSNAVKFSLENGTVSVLTGYNSTGGLSITVSDTGVGMTPAQISTASSPFGQIHDATIRAHKGTGLGLPLTIEFVELHGGTLDITSEPGRGTTININFPPERSIFPPE